MTIEGGSWEERVAKMHKSAERNIQQSRDKIPGYFVMMGGDLGKGDPQLGVIKHGKGLSRTLVQ